MQKQANQQIDMLKKQAETIMEQVREIENRLQVSYGIYEAEMKFTPKLAKNIICTKKMVLKYYRSFLQTNGEITCPMITF